MNNRYTAVIFDRDGVLTDFDLRGASAYFEALLPISIADMGEQWRTLGQKIGFPRSNAEEKQFWHAFWQMLIDQYQLPAATQEKLYQVDYKAFIHPFADARPALTAVRQHGLATGVLSNFTLASLPDSLTAVGLLDLIDIACAATVIGAAKPDPAAYHAVTDQLGTTPEKCLFFDDEIDCVLGARAVGMHAFLVDRQQPKHDLEAGIVADLTIVAELLQ